MTYLAILDQKCLIWLVFGMEFKKNIVIFEIGESLNLSCCKFCCKNKDPQIWEQKCPIWVFLGWNLKKLLSYLKSVP